MGHQSGSRGRQLQKWPLFKPLAAAVACSCALESQAANLEEVLVTATRRDQAVQDIPYNISVLSGEALQRGGISDLSSLARQIPGFTFIDLGVRSNGVASGIILRGMNASAAGINNFAPPPGNPTVTTYLNETPLFTNLKIADVQRVEVLRGPQGTLYGAGSVGGTVRFVYNRPDPERLSGDIQTKLSQTRDAGDLNYSADGVINIPMGGRAALRVAAGYEQYAGFVDAVNLVQLDASGIPVLADPSDPDNSPTIFYSKKDVDEADIQYLRAALLLDVSERLEVLVTVHRQKDSADDFTAKNPLDNRRQHRRLLESPLERETDLYSLELTADLGFATLTSASSYTDMKRPSWHDATGYIQSTVNAFYGGYPRPAYRNASVVKEQQFIQEVRLVSAESSGPDWLDWIAGIYYSDFERTNDVESSLLGYTDWLGSDFGSDVVFQLNQKIDTKETAFFGELTLKASEALQFTLGARYFDLDDTRVSDVGIPSIPLFNRGESDASDTGTLIKLNASYRVNDDLMIYATRSEGYRQGGANPVPTIGPFRIPDPALIPYQPDEATNYELGVKGQHWGWLNYSLAAYQIDWKRVQIQLPAPGSGIAILVNGNDAVSRGVELELRGAVNENLQLGFGYSYNKAELTDDFFIIQSVQGSDGDELPGVPNHQVTASMDYFQQTALFGASDLHYRLDFSYRNKTDTALNDQVGNFAKLDGFPIWNASVNWSSGSWRVGAFVNNILDEDGITAVDFPFPAASTDGNVEFLGRPRTMGVSVGYKF